MEKLKTKRDPLKQRNNISQLQIVRKVHLGFNLAGSDGEPAPFQLQAMGRWSLLGPAVPTGAVALQLLGVPMHVAPNDGGEGLWRVRFWPGYSPKATHRGATLPSLLPSQACCCRASDAATCVTVSK